MKEFKEIIEKLDTIIEDIQSEGGDRERGILEQVHHLETRIGDVEIKLNTILEVLDRIEINL